MKKNRLQLSRETIRRLSPPELGGVAGGEDAATSASYPCGTSQGATECGATTSSVLPTCREPSCVSAAPGAC